MKWIPLLLSACVSVLHAQETLLLPAEDSIGNAFANRNGAFALIDCSSGATKLFHEKESGEPLPPCSTFKIWNTLIGLEIGIISSPGEDFYKWDGKKRFIPEWNMNLNLKEAFQVSCVPAFQGLARKIGPEKMKSWINEIGYGDRNISAGIDRFWLPSPDWQPIRISPREQAGLIQKLVTGKLPFAQKPQAVLKEIMFIRKTERGTLYGKTGTGDKTSGTPVGWFVGYVESGERTFAFAAAGRWDKVAGKDLRALTETILEKNGFL
ncbi:MAG: penicillin-binding transpeptidase domain-containing protein [Verrucomicrobiae bacterium]|nr:penicillin-binding transpeptidase domain-containing protein [Verrucomicrobiae bacterium]